MGRHSGQICESFKHSAQKALLQDVQNLRGLFPQDGHPSNTFISNSLASSPTFFLVQKKAFWQSSTVKKKKFCRLNEILSIFELWHFFKSFTKSSADSIFGDINTIEPSLKPQITVLSHSKIGSGTTANAEIFFSNLCFENNFPLRSNK